MSVDWASVGITVAALAVIKGVLLFVAGGGSFARLGIAIQVFFKALGDAGFASRVEPLLNPPPPEPAKPPRLDSTPIRLLTLLQRDAQLLDFLTEDISAYGDEQVGAAVRDIHKKARKVIEDHLTFERILPGEEKSAVEVPPGFDPSAIQLTGNVTGKPPFRGTLMHPGWRVKGYKLPTPPEGQDDLVVAPAQVEV
jgi:hypothetical protein